MNNKRIFKIQVQLMSPVNHDEVSEEYTVIYEVSESTTFEEMFSYINKELDLEKKDFFPITIDYDLAEKIFKSTEGEVNKDGQISWDYKLEDQKILQSFREINIEPDGFSVICKGRVGTGGPVDIKTLLDELVQKFGPYLGSIVDIIEVGRIVKGFLNFLSVEKDVNAERVEKTIRSKTTWRIGCISTKKFEDKEIVEEQIMSLLEYTKDEEKQEWIDRNMG